MARRKADADQDSVEPETPHTHKTSGKAPGSGNATMHAKANDEQQEKQPGEPSAQAEAPPAGAQPDAGNGREAPVQRAEEMVDHLASRLGHYASAVGRQVLRLAARAREEVQDIWAEAQSIRRKE
jgi:hypothetical protein